MVSGGKKLVEGEKVRCNAWLLDDSAKIPYLVSTLWSEGTNVDSQVLDKIMGMPDVESMQVRLLFFFRPKRIIIILYFLTLHKMKSARRKIERHESESK